MSDRARIELNSVQVVASMAAAVTGAVLTSYLGDGGTIVGTAVGSGASTAGFAVYKHYLGRTKEKVAPVIVERARQWGPVTGLQASRGGSSPGTPGTGGTPDAGTRTAASPYRAANGGNGATAGRYAPGASADQTQPMHAGEPGTGNPGDGRTRDFGQAGSGRGEFGPPGFGQPGSGRGDSGQRDSGRGDAGQQDLEQRDFEQADTQTARPLGSVWMGGTGPEGNGGPGGIGGFSGGGPGNGHGDGGHGKHGAPRGGTILRDRPRWLVTAATSAAVFLVVMLVITLIEFGTGKPIDASVWGRKSSGTTLGNVTGGHSGATVTPTVGPTPAQSATPGGVGQTAPQPSSSASTGPSPSSVPSVSTAPSQNTPASGAPAQ